MRSGFVGLLFGYRVVKKKTVSILVEGRTVVCYQEIRGDFFQENPPIVNFSVTSRMALIGVDI